MNNGQDHTNSNGQPREASPSPSADPIATITEQAQQVIDGLDAAGLHYAAAAIQRQANKLETESDNLAKTIGQLANPKLLLALSYLKAGQIVDQNLNTPLSIGVQTLPKPKLQLPGLPSFSQFYSVDSSVESQPQLQSSSISDPNLDPFQTANNNSTTGNGKPKTEAGKGSGPQASN